jgi:hypothetical protein
MSSLVFRSDLLPRYKLVPLGTSIGYVQIISNDVAEASPRLVSSLISRVCHRFGQYLFLCRHKSIVTYAS